ncbi:hypothetical protein [Streptomyces sp. CS62]|uniref:hypothetical protein n=1 Tax=Streptomyces sp. CS62 TaxID=3119268 RepID=UPI002F947015
MDLLDLLLGLGVPVAAPGAGDALALEDWAGGEHRRDLVGLAADERFRPAFARAADALPDTDAARTVLRRLAAAPGGRTLLADWVRGLARACADTGLPQLPAAVSRLARLPAAILALAPGEVAEAAATDLAALLAGTLRGGLFEELTWPAWEEALAALAPHSDRGDVSVSTAWPHLVVANQRQARVIAAGGTVLVHDLRIPDGTGHRTLGLHYVDGELLVCWRYWNRPGDAQAYWHSAPADVFTLDTGGRSAWRLGPEHAGLPLPGGGRATGAGVLHRGDTRLPPERPLIGDRQAYWAWDEATADGQPAGWASYDPAADRLGPRSRPDFLAAAGLPAGAVLREQDCRLRPAAEAEGSVLSAPVGGLLGWRVAELPDGGWWGADTAGRTVTVPHGAGIPFGAAVLPGDDRPRALSQTWSEFRITDPDGTVTAETRSGSRPGTAPAGGPPMPPADHWHCLRPRDPQGSLALRAVDSRAAAALIAAGTAAAAAKPAGTATAEALLPVVRDALPQITDPVLARGVADTLAFTLDQQTLLDDGLAAGRSDEAEPQEPDGPDDRILGLALRGISGNVHRDWVGRGAHGVSATLSAFAAAAADTAATAVPGRLHGDVPTLPWCTAVWIPLLGQPAAVAYRAAAATDAEEREALLALLRAWDRLGLDAASAGRWRSAVLHLDARALRRPDGTESEPHHRGLLPLGGGAFLATTGACRAEPGGHRIEGLQYDPEGRFELPDAYTVRAAAPLGDPERETGWLGRFLDSAAARGPVPWMPAAADAFARLTGTGDTLARLVVAGLPAVDSDERGFLTAAQRTLLDVRAADADAARDDLRCLPADTRRALVAALLPADPARLWTDGPDAAAAAEVWNRRVGRRTRIPDRLTAEAAQEVRTWWPAVRALPAVLDPQNAPELSRDAEWELGHDRAVPKGPAADAFSARVLLGAVAMAAWLAHRLPAGDPARSRLPAALTAVRERLAAPGLLLDPGRRVDLRDLRKAAGAPTLDRREDRGVRGPRDRRRQQQVHARAATRPARLHRLRPVRGAAARHRPAAPPGGGGAAVRPRSAVRGAAGGSGGPGGGRCGRRGGVVAAGSWAFGSGAGRRRAGGVRTGCGRGGAVPDAAGDARPDGPEHGALDGLEAGPDEGGPGGTGRDGPGRDGEPDPGRAHPVPARRLGRARCAVDTAGAVEGADVRAARRPRPAPRRARPDRAGRRPVPAGLAAGHRRRRAPLRGAGAAAARPSPLTGPGPGRAVHARPGPGSGAMGAGAARIRLRTRAGRRGHRGNRRAAPPARSVQEPGRAPHQ